MAEHVIANTANGQVRGRILNSVRDGTYVSFQGIPYGKPPVGDLRFKPPQPAEPWQGVRDALKEGPSSPSLHMILDHYLPNSDEDCLCLNVYTPSVQSDRRLAVMFWIHGGGFYKGSGDTDVFGPDYLITENIVLVTINYRLGPFGFLGLNTPEYSGNNGLKDMVLALKWVQQNISNFGGDPANVTIFGESAGGAAVNYLLLSPLTKGLFHKAISMSGTVLNPWAFQPNPKKYAFLLAEELGLKTTDEKELINFLKTYPAKDMAINGTAMQERLNMTERNTSLAFVPCVEPEGTKDAFITKSPLELLKIGQIHDVPYITGIDTLEGGIILFSIKNRALEKEEDYYRCIPAHMNLQPESEVAKNVVAKIKERYFKDGYSVRSHIDVLSRIYFNNGIQDNILYQVSSKKKNPTYSYQFTYDGEKRLLKTLLGYGQYPGTVHADELGYLFHANMLEAKLVKETKDYEIVETFTKLWSDFAKTGIPTPTWKPVTPTEDNYLEIGEVLTLRQNLEESERKFWNDLYTYVESSKK